MFASLTQHVGVKAADICVTLVNCLNGDQVDTRKTIQNNLICLYIFLCCFRWTSQKNKRRNGRTDLSFLKENRWVYFFTQFMCAAHYFYPLRIYFLTRYSNFLTVNNTVLKPETHTNSVAETQMGACTGKRILLV